MNMTEFTIADLIERRIRPSSTYDIPEVLYHTRMIALDGKTGKILFDTCANRQERVRKYYSGRILSLWTEMKQESGRHGGFSRCTYEPVLVCYIQHDSWNDLASDADVERKEIIDTLKELARNEEATVKWGVHPESIERAKRRLKALNRAIESIEQEDSTDG